MRSPYTESGQAALIIVLTSVVLLTLGVGAVARTTTDVRLSAQSQESAAAFAAAEAGAELGLLSRTSGTWETPVTGIGIASATYNVVSLPDTMPYNLGAVLKGDSKTIWMVDDPTNPFSAASYVGDITIEWDPDTAEVDVAAYYRDSGDVMVKRWVVDASDQITLRSSDPPINDEWIAVRVRPIMENITQLNISGYNWTLPSQGYKVESTGYTASGITRKVVVTRFHKDAPALFDLTIMSNSRLTKP